MMKIRITSVSPEYFSVFPIQPKQEVIPDWVISWGIACLVVITCLVATVAILWCCYRKWKKDAVNFPASNANFDWHCVSSKT